MNLPCMVGGVWCELLHSTLHPQPSVYTQPLPPMLSPSPSHHIVIILEGCRADGLLLGALMSHPCLSPFAYHLSSPHPTPTPTPQGACLVFTILVTARSPPLHDLDLQQLATAIGQIRPPSYLPLPTPPNPTPHPQQVAASFSSSQSPLIPIWNPSSQTTPPWP